MIRYLNELGLYRRINNLYSRLVESGSDNIKRIFQRLMQKEISGLEKRIVSVPRDDDAKQDEKHKKPDRYLKEAEKAARLMGLRKKDIAQEIGIDLSYYYNISSGNVPPSAELVGRMDCFFAFHGIRLDEMAFSSRSNEIPLADLTAYDKAISSEESVEGELLLKDKELAVRRALSRLTPRESKVIKMYFGIGTKEMNLDEIGELFGLTGERIRQIKVKAIHRLSHPRIKRELREYL